MEVFTVSKCRGCGYFGEKSGMQRFKERKSVHWARRKMTTGYVRTLALLRRLGDSIVYGPKHAPTSLNDTSQTQDVDSGDGEVCHTVGSNTQLAPSPIRPTSWSSQIICDGGTQVSARLQLRVYFIRQEDFLKRT